MKETEVVKYQRFLLVVENRLFGTVNTHLFHTREEAIEKATRSECDYGSKDQALIVDLVTEQVYQINPELLGESIKPSHNPWDCDTPRM